MAASMAHRRRDDFGSICAVMNWMTGLPDRNHRLSSGAASGDVDRSRIVIGISRWGAVMTSQYWAQPNPPWWWWLTVQDGESILRLSMSRVDSEWTTVVLMNRRSLEGNHVGNSEKGVRAVSFFHILTSLKKEDNLLNYDNWALTCVFWFNIGFMILLEVDGNSAVIISQNTNLVGTWMSETWH